MTRRVLVIKLAALGDFALAFGPFAAIRAHHPTACITLLTTPPYAALARQSPWFDEVWDDGRPPARRLPALLLRLRRARFDRVYDLQTSGRSSRYRLAVGRKAEWSGIARGASHPHRNPGRDTMHTLDRQREQLADAGIPSVPQPDLTWLDRDLEALQLPRDFIVLVPGASPDRPGKRWPAAAYAALARRLAFPAILLGGRAEAPLASEISELAPGVRDLTGRTDFAAIAAIGRRAAYAIGNDTGPMHLLAAVGCPCLVLFGDDSDPALCAPRGAAAQWLRHLPLQSLPVERVLHALPASLTGGGAGDQGPAVFPAEEPRA